MTLRKTSRGGRLSMTRLEAAWVEDRRNAGRLVALRRFDVPPLPPLADRISTWTRAILRKPFSLWHYRLKGTWHRMEKDTSQEATALIVDLAFDDCPCRIAVLKPDAQGRIHHVVCIPNCARHVWFEVPEEDEIRDVTISCLPVVPQSLCQAAATGRRLTLYALLATFRGGKHLRIPGCGRLAHVVHRILRNPYRLVLTEKGHTCWECSPNMETLEEAAVKKPLIRVFVPPEYLVRSRYEVVEPAKRHRRLCLFAHYEPSGEIEDYVHYHLRALHDQGCDLALVSTSEELTPTAVERVRALCRLVVTRRGSGRDFGSFRLGMSLLPDLHEYDQVVLTNDSVYGPMCDLVDVFRLLDGGEADIVGITDSRQDGDYHIQTYFAAFGHRFLHSDAFHRFWGRMPYHKTRVHLVQLLETPLSVMAAKEGFRLRALCPYERLKRVAGESKADPNHAMLTADAPTNPMLFGWDLLIARLRCPYLKIAAFDEDDDRVSPTLEAVCDVVSKHTDYDPGLIRNHYRRRHASP